MVARVKFAMGDYAQSASDIRLTLHAKANYNYILVHATLNSC